MIRRSLLVPAALLGLASFATACGNEAFPAPPAAPKAPVADDKPAPPASPPRIQVGYENPGGMWMPSQIATPAHEEMLKKLGLTIDPKELSNPESPLLSSIVSLGGCSASFVSGDGLVITNHHCATGALGFNSSPKENLLKDGFLAKTRAEERSNGPQARVYVTRKLTDVTTKVLDGTATEKDHLKRYKLVETHSKELVSACEKDRPGTRCTLASYYSGKLYVLIDQMEIRDVRLVYAPASGVGNYGGEIDNWRWPRHTGDVSMFRAYVGKDGKPADFSPENVPYKAPHHLSVAKKPLAQGDLVMVAGYPGRTQSWRSGPEVDEAIAYSYPRRQQFCEEALARLGELGKISKDVEIRATPSVRRYGNALTNTKGQLEGLVKGGLAQRKSEDEAKLAAFIDGDAGRKAKYGDVLSELRAAVNDNAKTREADTQLRTEITLPSLVSAAVSIVRTVKERQKPDAERRPEYQERNVPRIDQSLAALEKTYARPLDEGLFVFALERIAKSAEADRTPAFKLVLPKGDVKDAKKSVAALYAKTKLEDPKVRHDLLMLAKPKDIDGSKDPLIVLARKLVPLLEAAEDREHALEGRLLPIKARYVDAKREMVGKEVAPDANSTLRITYGTVRGYSPAKDAPAFMPFTTLTSMLAKNTGKEPFDVPARLVAAATAKKLGAYTDKTLGDLPVDFLADLHITGGNSGSATLDADGHITGLVFDGNYEAMASDWLFLPEITRSIHVDIRYVLWLLDAVDGGDHLLKEMGVTPSVD